MKSRTIELKKLGKAFKLNEIRMLAIAGLFIGVGIIMEFVQRDRPLNYKQLLSTIAEGESRNNYNAYYGNATNKDIRFTEMTIQEVMEWQEQYVKNGSPSSAVGKYQIIRPTLEGLVIEHRLDPATKYDEATQDKLAIALIERRGVKEYSRGKISREEFAHNLSQEWAALPAAVGDKPAASFYEGDGLNHVQVNIKDIYKGIDALDDPPEDSNLAPNY